MSSPAQATIHDTPALTRSTLPLHLLKGFPLPSQGDMVPSGPNAGS